MTSSSEEAGFNGTNVTPIRLAAKKRLTPRSEISDHHAMRSPGRAPSASKACENRFAEDCTSPKVIASSPNVTARRSGAAPAAQVRTSFAMSGIERQRPLGAQPMPAGIPFSIAPASILMFMPVMYRASSLARNETRLLTSDGSM